MKQKRGFGLIGKTITHSFSKDYFTNKFEKEEILDCEFNLFPLADVVLLPALLQLNPNIEGLSVTIPYKESVMELLHEQDETARKVGAVNCIKIQRTNAQPKLIGYNTDVFGFRQSIKPFLESQHERALILGTGGASKSVEYVLNEIGIDCYFVSRDKASKTNRLPSNRRFEYQELTENYMKAFKLIVNTTPLGMFPDVTSAPAIPYEFLTPSHLLYDLTYNPKETEFLKRGKQQGTSIVNGYSMLKQQAEEAWRIWNK